MSSIPAPPAIEGTLASGSWSIAEVERETGLGKDTLRIWERRYGFPRPGRDGQGERSYPTEQLQRLRQIRRLMDAGHRPGQVVPLAPTELQALLEASGSPATGRGKAARPEPSTLQDEAQWIAWLAGNQTTQIRHAIQQQILRLGLGHAVDQLIGPLCALVGRAWMRGDISVYQEHLFSESLQSVLREGIAAVDAVQPQPLCRPRILLTTTPHEMHRLGLLMAECHFALESCERFVLGTSTPLEDIAHAVQHLHADVLALSFSAHAGRNDVLGKLAQLRSQLPPACEIWIGGAGSQLQRRLLPPGVMRLRKAGDIAAQIRAWRQAAAG